MLHHTKWASMRENLSSGVCEQQRRRTAWADGQYDQGLPLIFANWKVSYLDLITAKFQLSS